MEKLVEAHVHNLRVINLAPVIFRLAGNPFQRNQRSGGDVLQHEDMAVLDEVPLLQHGSGHSDRPQEHGLRICVGHPQEGHGVRPGGGANRAGAGQRGVRPAGRCEACAPTGTRSVIRMAEANDR